MARCSMRQSLLLPLVAIVDSSGRTRGPYVAGVLEVARSKAASVMSEALLKLILCALGVSFLSHIYTLLCTSFGTQLHWPA
jgi:hypothetical protein